MARAQYILELNDTAIGLIPFNPYNLKNAEHIEMAKI
jgi:hypothetical protein